MYCCFSFLPHRKLLHFLCYSGVYLLLFALYNVCINRSGCTGNSLHNAHFSSSIFCNSSCGPSLFFSASSCKFQNPISIQYLFLNLGSVAGQTAAGGQQDPCQLKTRVVGDETYCDRYWECINGQPQLFDCPNGLVFVGRNRGIAEGCDYPWRGNYCFNKQAASKLLSSFS